ncbi:MAG TPA: GTPase HflX [Acidobacteriota bacterium]|nr:GTPase HflX [Acidobacteriota bacterium]
MVLEMRDVPERAILVGFGPRQTPPGQLDASLDELTRLVETADGRVAGRVVQRGRPHPAHLIGTGKLAEIGRMSNETHADLIVFDDELSPSQIANLEERLDCKVLDRSMLILAIFARHAHTKEAKTQVELAQYQYLYPRLSGHWTHMTRHVGGIGTRGPGETQLETDRRLVGQRIQRLKERLKLIDKERAVQRRGRNDLFRAVMVGYTNAGKSTLFNRLTRSRVWAADRLFCTLDPTSRTLAHGGRRIVLTDTIGFIRKLPATVFAAFRATLAEVTAADLILVVVDYADPNYRETLDEVERSLGEINADQNRRLYVLNKIDLLNGAPNESSPTGLPAGEVVAVSATDGIGIDRLVAAIVEEADRCRTGADDRRARTAKARVRYERRPPTE